MYHISNIYSSIVEKMGQRLINRYRAIDRWEEYVLGFYHSVYHVIKNS
jgi:hypothetical protein